MKRVVSVSLGSPSRDKKVEINLRGQQIMVERIGTGGDPAKARTAFYGIGREGRCSYSGGN